MTKWANEKLKYHKWAFGEFYEYALEVNQFDDRITFISIYEQVQKAIEAVSSADSHFVHVAMNEKIKKSYETLRNIQKNFWEGFKANIA